MTKGLDFNKMTKGQLVELLVSQPYVGCPSKEYLQKHTKSFLVKTAQWIESNSKWN